MIIKIKRTEVKEHNDIKKYRISHKNNDVNVCLLAYKNIHLVNDESSDDMKWVNTLNLTIAVVDGSFSRNSSEEILINIEKTINSKIDSSEYKEFYFKINDVLKDKKIVDLVEKIQKIKIIISQNNLKAEVTSDAKYLPAKKIYNKNYDKVSNYKGNTRNKGDNKNIFEKFKDVPYFIIIDALQELNLLKYSYVASSGDEDTYSITYTNSNESSKIALVSSRSLSSAPWKLCFNDFKDVLFRRNIRDGGLSLIKGFIEAGLYDGVKIKSVKGGSKEVNKDYNKKIYSLLEQLNKVIESESYEYSDYSNVERSEIKVRRPSRMPTLSNKHNDKTKWFNYLVDVRKLNADIINREFCEKRMMVGNMYSNTNSFQGGHLFFNVKDLNNASTTAQKLSFVRGTNDKKADKRFMLDRKINGQTYNILSKKPVSTVLSEATIDILAMECLLKASPNHNSDNYNYISVKNCGNLVPFLEYNFGFGFNKKLNDDDEIDLDKLTYTISQEVEFIELSESKINLLKEYLSGRKITYIDDGTLLSKEELKKIDTLLSILELNLSDQIKVNNLSSYVDMKGFDRTYDLKGIKVGKDIEVKKNKDYIMDKTSVSIFLKENNLSIKLDKGSKKYMLCEVKTVNNHSYFDSNDINIINSIKNKMINKLGTSSLTLCFDNDITALKYYLPFSKMCETLGIKYNIIAPLFSYDNNYVVDKTSSKLPLNDTNDMLIYYKSLLHNEGIDIANAFLDNFFSSNVAINGEFNKERYDLLNINASAFEEIKDNIKENNNSDNSNNKKIQKPN